MLLTSNMTASNIEYTELECYFQLSQALSIGYGQIASQQGSFVNKKNLYKNLKVKKS